MKNLAIGIILPLALILNSCSLFYHKADKEHSELSGIIPQPDDDFGSYAMEARYSNWPNPDTLIIYIDGQRHRVTANGDVLTMSGEKRLSLGNEFPIEQLYFAQRGQDLFVFFTDVDVRGAGSFAKRISLETGQTLWTTEMDGFSFSKPVIRGQFVYVGTIGFIGKMKLKNGHFDWKFSGLGKTGRFNHFRDIDFPNQHEVRFVAPHPFSVSADTVVVNDITGEILMMN